MPWFILRLAPTRERNRTESEPVSQLQQKARIQTPEEAISDQGVLPDKVWRDAIRQGWVSSGEDAIPDENIQPASLDLRLGPRAYRLRSSFLPGPNSVETALGDYQLGPPIPLDGGAVLEQNRPYLIPLLETLNLPKGTRAKANPKSSVGRLDIFTRVLVDNSPGFDAIPVGYSGPMYLEVVSRSFTIKVATGVSLNQIRLVNGASQLTDDKLNDVHASTPLVYRYVKPRPGVTKPIPAVPIISDGLFLTVDLSVSADRVVGYRAKKNSGLLDLSRVAEYDPKDFWEQVRADQHKRLILEPEEFYLLMSLEGVSIPRDLAAEMTAYDPTSGELRTHYAGFFDPGFGFSNTGGKHGSRAVLEVRAHDVPFALQHRQKIARLVFERMASLPDRPYGPGIGSSYQYQELKLSKMFREWPLETERQMSFDVP